MEDKLITSNQVFEWFDDLEAALKDSIVSTPIMGANTREEQYMLYQAAQLLKARFLQDFRLEVEMTNNEYDPD